MNDKKHIDRLFQEKLKDFEAVPNDAIWESIRLKLHEKKRKRRVIPLWWQMAGVAAVLALLFTIGNSIFYDGIDNKTKPIVNTDTIDNPSVPPPPSDSNIILNNFEDENVAAAEDENETSNSDSKNNNGTVQTPNKAVTAIANSKRNSNNSKVTEKSVEELNQALINSKNESKIASNSKVDDVINYSDPTKSDQEQKGNAQNKPHNETLIGNPQKDIKTSVADNDPKKEILELKAENEKDSQTIEDAFAQVNNIDEREEDEKVSRWNISTNVAPVYFNSFGNESTIDQQFVGDSKSGEINFSYGINGGYAVNKKLKIRAGINKVNLGYNIDQVDISGGIMVSLKANIKSASKVSSGKAENSGDLNTQNLSYNIVPDLLASNFKTSINQELGFIEVPLEIEYAILNKKFGVNVISGFSALFLDNNNVYSTLNGEKVFIGEAQNINNTSYSANFGLGLNYSVSEKIKLNLEPTFKYQINTFRDTSGDFQPYFIGIYTGLSYKF